MMLSPDTTDTQTLAQTIREHSALLADWAEGTVDSVRADDARVEIIDATDRLVAAVAALQHERDEAREHAKYAEECEWHADQRTAAAEERVRVLEARQAKLEQVATAALAVNSNARLTAGEDIEVRIEDMDALADALRVLDADTPEEDG